MLGCFDSWKFQGGYDGDIQEYTIETSAYLQEITIVVNKRRKIQLLVDLYGPDDELTYRPCNFQDVTTFEIDGKPVEGYENEN